MNLRISQIIVTALLLSSTTYGLTSIGGGVPPGFSHPVVVVGVHDAEDALFTGLRDELLCRGVGDAFFIFPLLGTSLSGLAQQLSHEVAELTQVTTVTQVVVIGHNVGGLVARRAATRDSLVDDAGARPDVPISLITFFAPFAGVHPLPAGFPPELGTDSTFIRPSCPATSAHRSHTIRSMSRVCTR